ncbi:MULTISPECIES: hypothetical protein [Microbulbifer]|uniref:hypothetical protein n=1 Tax=Microbulbifer TaxID=48073 RepID=UPI001144EAA1|nr:MULTISPECIES: hypothetical protein [Microbulbifer]
MPKENLAINLSDNEKWLLVELTDFSKTLPELISEIHSDAPEKRLMEKYEVAIGIVNSLVSKGLVSLCEIACSSNEPYSVESVKVLTNDDLEFFINDPWSWRSSFSRDNKWQYELTPTKKGEAVLDEIFALRKSN